MEQKRCETCANFSEYYRKYGIKFNKSKYGACVIGKAHDYVRLAEQSCGLWKEKVSLAAGSSISLIAILENISNRLDEIAELINK